MIPPFFRHNSIDGDHLRTQMEGEIEIAQHVEKRSYTF